MLSNRKQKTDLMCIDCTVIVEAEAGTGGSGEWMGGVRTHLCICTSSNDLAQTGIFLKLSYWFFPTFLVSYASSEYTRFPKMFLPEC